MTLIEFQTLSLNDLYEFKLYNGVIKHGYIEQDINLNKFYIINPKKKEDKFEIKLNQIVKWDYIKSINQPSSFKIIQDIKYSKKAVILGAGASFDFSHETKIDDNDRMPLTKSLFHDRYNYILNNYPGAYNLSSEILLSSDIESYFQKQWDKVKRNYDPLLLTKLINTQFYIHELFLHLSSKFSKNKKSNYFNLVKLAHEYTIENENEFIPIISFNYDTLIEEAITRNLQLNFNEIDDYIDHNNRKILLFKPHGSANWVKYFNPTFMDLDFAYQIDHISKLSNKIYELNYDLSTLFENINEDINVLDPFHFKSNSQTPNFYFPWLLIPFKDKDESMLPKEHESTLKKLLPKIDELLIIGWKGTEENFKLLLKNCLREKEIRITLIEPDDKSAQNFIKSYTEILPKSKINHIKKEPNSEYGLTFSDYTYYCQNNLDHFFNN